MLEREQLITAGSEVHAHKTAIMTQLVDTGAVEFNDYLGGFALPTSGDRQQTVPVANPHQDEHQMGGVSAAGILLNLRSAKPMHTGTRHAAPPDPAFKLWKRTDDENSAKITTESAMALNRSRSVASKAAGQNSLVHLIAADYAYRGPFFVRNTSTSNMPRAESKTSRKKKGSPSSGSKSPPARATLEHLEHVSDVARHRPTPAPEQKGLTDTDLDSGRGGFLTSSFADSKYSGLTKDPEPCIQQIPGMPGPTLETKTQHRAPKRGAVAGSVLYTTSATQMDRVPIISGTSDSESDLYNLHNPAVSSRLLRRPPCNETGTQLAVGAITELSPEQEHTRITDIWSFFAYLICNLRCEEIIEEDGYHERALWRTCVTLVKDNGCLAVFARMDDPTMVALGVPVSLIPRVWKDLLVWTLADGGPGFGPDECDNYRMSDEEDARCFVTWGSDDGCCLGSEVS